MNDYDTILDLIVKDQPQKLKKLLESGADPNCCDESGYTPLHWAAQEGRVEITKQLLAAGANVEAKEEGGFMPLQQAVGGNHIEVVMELLKAGASPNTRVKSNGNSSVLHTACAYGYFDMVKLLANTDGIDLNLKNKRGQTPLFFARDGGFTRIVNYLIKRGAHD